MIIFQTLFLIQKDSIALANNPLIKTKESAGSSLNLSIKGDMRVIAGVDEAGRGALAGPVVSCCVSFKDSFIFYDDINDSKKLSKKKRAHTFDLIRPHIHLGIGMSSHRLINKVNIVINYCKLMRYIKFNN